MIFFSFFLHSLAPLPAAVFMSKLDLFMGSLYEFVLVPMLYFLVPQSSFFLIIFLSIYL